MRHTNLRLIILTTVATTAAMLIAGCSSGQAAPVSPTATETSGPIPIPPGQPSAKAKLIQAENATIQAARRHPVPKGTPPPLPTTSPPIRRAGIDNTFHQSPVGKLLRVMNFWKGPIGDDTWAFVYAGGKITGFGQDSGEPPYEIEGGIWLSIATGDPSSTQFKVADVGFLPAPVAVPSLRITAWPSADVIALEAVSNTGAPTGATMDFNVVTRTFNNVKTS